MCFYRKDSKEYSASFENIHKGEKKIVKKEKPRGDSGSRETVDIGKVIYGGQDH